MKKLMKCTNCDEILSADAMNAYDGNFYCEECFLRAFYRMR